MYANYILVARLYRTSSEPVSRIVNGEKVKKNMVAKKNA